MLWRYGVTGEMSTSSVCFRFQTYAVVTNVSEHTKNVVKLNTEDRESEEIHRGLFHFLM